MLINTSSAGEAHQYKLSRRSSSIQAQQEKLINTSSTGEAYIYCDEDSLILALFLGFFFPYQEIDSFTTYEFYIIASFIKSSLYM